MTARALSAVPTPVGVREAYVDRAGLAEIMGLDVSTIDRMRKAGMPSETWGMRSRRFLPSAAIEWARTRGLGSDEGRSAA